MKTSHGYWTKICRNIAQVQNVVALAKVGPSILDVIAHIIRCHCVIKALQMKEET